MSRQKTITTQDKVILRLHVVDEELGKLKHYSVSEDRLKIKDEIGSGGFGIVFRAELLPPKDSYGEPTIEVVVKKLKVGEWGVIPERAAVRLVREMIVWSQCKHENILLFTGYHLGDGYDPAYLISPYMKNGNLKEYVKANSLSPEERLKFAHDTISGLEYLHTKNPVIVHGDLKAANVLVSDHRKAQLCDFGLATAVQEAVEEEEAHTGLTTNVGFTGSIRWCSPEIMAGDKKTRENDMWSWGCLVLEMMTDKMPFDHVKARSDFAISAHVLGKRNTPEPVPEPVLPEGLLDILRMCWNFNPKERPDARSCCTALTEKLQRSQHALEERAPSWADKLGLLFRAYFIPSKRIVFQEDLGYGRFVMTRRGILLPEDFLSDQPPQGVVVKEIKISGFKESSERVKMRLLRETFIWSTCDHPNILPFIGYHTEESDSLPSFIYPYMRNGSVRDYIRANNVDAELRLSFVHDTIKGLTYLHSRDPPILHGNLKGTNVLVDDVLHAELCDFGLTTVIEFADAASGNTTTISSGESVRWCSPEVLEGSRKTLESDIWAWGCLVLEIMTGTLPFDHMKFRSEFAIAAYILGQRQTPEPVPAPVLPRDLLQLLRQCWQFDPGMRPSASICLASM